MIKALHKYSNFLGGVLIAASLASCFYRFGGDWKKFFTVLVVQLWFAQAIYGYLKGGRVSIGPGGLEKDADPVWRAILASVALLVYLVVFFLEF
ncbi:hypothetical protein NVV94_03450 [Pseudomonas sp. LS1212]|uniref:hypothetical protein n=1 Tax=Pseudomonas sp. LS1212 TaxID=2972478 RepID=UPI00215C5B66|nr:hypothetical protein [Pseudomonas sp. LS1212]UVJ44671.1 hypothetical protein NVV94_03450 [Pseudomonas sp. LS1212]